MEWRMPEQVVWWNLEDEIDAENPVRFIRVFVDALDLKELGFKRPKAAEKGRPPYAAQDLLALFLYGHLNHLRSSRRLERECARNIELWWLMGRQVPDHNTIANFRRDNTKAIKNVFTRFVRICMELKLIGGKEVCVDGTTMKASNSLKRSTSKELSERKAEYYRKRIAAVEQYLAACEEEDQKEQRREALSALDISADKLPSVEHMKERLAFHEEEIQPASSRTHTAAHHKANRRHIFLAFISALLSCLYSLKRESVCYTHPKQVKSFA